MRLTRPFGRFASLRTDGLIVDMISSGYHHFRVRCLKFNAEVGSFRERFLNPLVKFYVDAPQGATLAPQLLDFTRE